jgi:peptidylprolyl isomerase
VDDPGLKEVSTGVKSRDIKEGIGEACPPGAEVKIHYTGWLPDGTVFDSSKDRGQPATFKLAGLIQGWQEGIPGMKPGGIRKLVILPDKGYGQQNKGKIPPGSTLIFEVELLEVIPQKNVTTGPGKPMSDGSNGGTEDPGLKEIESGLKYRDLKEGSGEPVKEGATVTVHYTGWTVDGNQFDSSKTKGKPMTSPLGGLVVGWQKGIPGMKPGGVRKLVIPAALGYGDRGSPPDSPGGATLIFEIELLQ